jgi:hypothetical protein
MAAPKGNNYAGKAKVWSAAIERALDKRALKQGNKTRAEALEELADKLIDACLEGNLLALKELADRLDGKPAQQVELSSDPDAPVILQLTSADANL